MVQVARCTKIIDADSDDPKYIINVKQFAKFVVDLADSVAPTDIEEGMRVGVDRNKYQIHIPLPPKIDPSVTMMQVRVSNIECSLIESRTETSCRQFERLSSAQNMLMRSNDLYSN